MIIKNSSFVFIFNSLGILINLLITILISRKLGLASLGIFTLVVSNIRLLSFIYKIGLDITLIRFVDNNLIQNKSNLTNLIYNNSIKITLLIGFLSSLFIFPFKNDLSLLLLKESEISNYFIIICISAIPLSIIIINSGLLKGIKNYKLFSFLQFFIVNAITLLIYFIFSNNINNIFIVLQIYMFVIVVVAICSTIYIFIKYKFNFINSPVKKIIKSKLIKITIPVFLSNSLNTIVPLIDIFMIGIISSPEEVALYNVSFRIATISILILSSVNHVTMPLIAEYNKHKNKGKLIKIIKKSTALSIFLSLPIFILIIFFPEKILLIFGEKFLDGKLILFILILSQIVNIFTGPLGDVLQMVGLEKINKNITIFSILIKYIFIFIFMKYSSIIILIAISNVLYYMLVKLIPLVYFRKL